MRFVCPTGCEEDLVATGQVSLLQEVGSEARVQRIEGRYMARASSGAAAEGVWFGKWHTEQREAWLNQVLEVQMWRQVRGLAGAVMCETRDLGIKWPHWHTMMFEGEVRTDMRYVGPEDVRKVLLQQARSAYCKKWTAKHEYEELK